MNKFEQFETKLEKLDEKLQKSKIVKLLGKIDSLFYKHWREVLISIIYVLIFIGVFHILPTFPFFITYDDTSGNKGKMLLSAMISLLITTSVIVNKKEKHQKVRCIIVLFSLCIIVFFLVCKGILHIEKIWCDWGRIFSKSIEKQCENNINKRYIFIWNPNNEKKYKTI